MFANASNLGTSPSTIAVATEDVAASQFGYFTNFGSVRDIDTSAWEEGDLLYLGTSDGQLTNVVPSSPNAKVVVGKVINKHATEGVITVNIHPLPLELNDLTVNGNINISNDATVFGQLWVGSPDKDNIDKIYHGTSYILNGMSENRQDMYILTESGNIYFEIEAIGGGDMEYVFAETECTLDCTTGSGVNGRARVQLTEGTAAIPQINYIYITCTDGETAILNASTSVPDASDSIAWVAQCIVQEQCHNHKELKRVGFYVLLKVVNIIKQLMAEQVEQLLFNTIGFQNHKGEYTCIL